MKTIEVSDEMYASLMEMSKEMNSQDHRGTRMPYILQVATSKTVAAYPDCGNEVWVNNEGDELDSEAEVRDYVLQYIYSNDERISGLSDLRAKTKALTIIDEMDDSDLYTYLESIKHEEWKTVRTETERRQEGFFFTVKACQEHIECNKHQYNEPATYTQGMFRNPELELVQRFLCELSGGRLHT